MGSVPNGLEARASIQGDRGFISVRDGQLHDENVAPRRAPVDGRLQQGPGGAVASPLRHDVHADDQRLVLRLGLRGELERNRADEFGSVEGSERHGHPGWIGDATDPPATPVRERVSSTVDVNASAACS